MVNDCVLEVEELFDKGVGGETFFEQEGDDFIEQAVEVIKGFEEGFRV